MPKTDLGGMDWFTKREHLRRAKAQPMRGENFDFRPFNHVAALGEKPFPSYEQLLTPSAKARIEKIYAIDFRTYGPYL